MRKIGLFATLLVVLFGLAGGGFAARAATLDSGENDLLAQVNAFRASRGLSALVVSDPLTAAAKWMATDMSVNDYFQHTSLDGRSPTQRMADAGYPAFATWAGEDLAAGYTSAADVLNGWINSPAHQAVLTNPEYRAIGIGRSYSERLAVRLVLGRRLRWRRGSRRQRLGQLRSRASTAPGLARAPTRRSRRVR